MDVPRRFRENRQHIVKQRKAATVTEAANPFASQPDSVSLQVSRGVQRSTSKTS